MANRLRSLTLAGTSLVLALLASFAAQAAQAAQTHSASAVPAPTDASNKSLRAAAEPFENLTEIAFSATWLKIDRIVGQAEAAATAVRRVLSQHEAGRLDGRIAAVKAARQKHDRADLALSSIETYRVLVSAVTDNAKVPTEVSLLDYAGYRYHANLKAKPTNWDDMARAASFARKTWDVLSPRAKASAVARRFETTLTDMDNAVVKRSRSLAATSVKTELELVDLLENFFSAQ